MRPEQPAETQDWPDWPDTVGGGHDTDWALPYFLAKGFLIVCGIAMGFTLGITFGLLYFT